MHVNGWPIIVGLIAGIPAVGYGQGAGDTNRFVSVQEYQKLKAEHDRLREELETVKRQMQELLKRPAAPGVEVLKTQAQAPAATNQALLEAQQAIDDLEKQLKDVKQMAKQAFPGTTRMLLTGYGAATYTVSGHGWGPATPLPPEDRHGRNFFTATFNPIFLWKLSDRVLFESEFEVELEDGETDLALEYAQIDYVLNDYMTIVAGKFLTPSDYFTERLHPQWINKLPDRPLAVFDGIMPESVVGAQVRGGIPLGPTKAEYALYVANAPSLVTTPASPDNPIDVGTLNFENFENTGNHVAVGGHAGVFLIPQVEIGYGFQVAGVGPSGSDLNSLMQSVDFNYVQDWPQLLGVVELRAQWAWLGVDKAPPEVVSGLSFNNNRNGGYVQLAYRPSRLQNFLKDFEPVVRYDMLNQRRTPVGFDESRWTAGLIYWLGPSMLLKGAYQHDHQNGTGHSGDALLFQVALGF